MICFANHPEKIFAKLSGYTVCSNQPEFPLMQYVNSKTFVCMHIPMQLVLKCTQDSMDAVGRKQNYVMKEHVHGLLA